jgi:hypothetical protein
MIRINLHDYRQELKKIETQKRVVKCLAIIVAAVFLIIMSWLMEQARLDLVKSETRKLQSQVAGLKQQVDRVKAMEAKQKRLESIIVGIDNLRENQVPASILVSDLNMRVPDGLWLGGIVQRDLAYLKKNKIPIIMFGDPDEKSKGKKKQEKSVNEFLEVVGFALTESDIVEYVKRLQALTYFNTAFLYQSSQTNYGLLLYAR